MKVANLRGIRESLSVIRTLSDRLVLAPVSPRLSGRTSTNDLTFRGGLKPLGGERRLSAVLHEIPVELIHHQRGRGVSPNHRPAP